MAQVQEDLELQDSLKAIISAGSGASALVALGKQKGHSFTEEEVLNFEGVARSWSEPSYPSSLSEEDPTFRVSTNEETGQTLISGMGELHLDF